MPFEYSMRFLLRYYVAEHGLDPDKDIQIRVVPPPEMVANLRAGNVDGYLHGPFCQRAVYDGVGFIHMLTGKFGDSTHVVPLGLVRNLPLKIQIPSLRFISQSSNQLFNARRWKTASWFQRPSIPRIT